MKFNIKIDSQMSRIRSLSLFSILGLFLCLGSCTKKEDLTDQVNSMRFLKDQDLISNDIDRWLYDNFTEKYNVRVEYKFNRGEVAWKALTPPDESKVIPVAQLLLDYFIDVYEAETDEFFIKTYLPKQYMFVGSPEYNPNGTQTTGSAYAGRKVVLFRLNQYKGEWPFGQRMLKTIHHEFGHILDMNKRVGPSYEEINKADYVDDDWLSFTDQQANNLGIITSYGMSAASEDFVEMIAVMIVYGQRYFDHIVANTSDEGAARLRLKERIVVDYFKNNWDIDFRALQRHFEERVEVPWEPPYIPTMEDLLGYDKVYDEFVYDPSDPLLKKSSKFDFELFKTELLGYGSRELLPLRIAFQDDDVLQVKVYSYRPSNASTGYNSVRFDAIKGANGIYTFKLATTSGSILNYTQSLQDYFTSHTFKKKFQEDSDTHGGFYVVGEESTNWVTGELMN